MKHGLKQEIKRGLSVLMAVSMVASSALPVMAEEVVEEAVEVETVSEEVADEAEDVVVDVVEDEDVVEEVVDGEELEVITEEAADAQCYHTYEYLSVSCPVDENGAPKYAEVTEKCTKCGETQYGYARLNKNDDDSEDYFYNAYYVGVTGFSGGQDACEWTETITYVLYRDSDDKALYSKKFTVTGDEHEPKEGTWNISKPATCEENAIESFTCSKCEKKVTRKVEDDPDTTEDDWLLAQGHTLKVDSVKFAADYKTAAVTYKCSAKGCGKTVEINVDVTSSGDESSCMNVGTKTYKAYLTGDNAESKIVKADKSIKDYIQSVDSVEEYEDVDLPMQVPAPKNGKVTFTFEDDVMAAVFTCATCGEEHTFTSDLNAKYANKRAPEYKTYEVKVEAVKTNNDQPTCQEGAIELYKGVLTLNGKKYESTKSNDGEQLFKKEVAAGEAHHSFTNNISVKTAQLVNTEPTCMSVGYGTFYCTYCKQYIPNVRIPRAAHNFGTKTADKAATCTEDATYTATCKDCGKTYAEVVELLNDYITYNENNPSLFAEAFIAEYEAQLKAVEKEMIVAGTAGHKFEVADPKNHVVWTDDYSAVRVTFTCANDNCSSLDTSNTAIEETKTVTVTDIKEVIDVEPGFDTKGSKHYEAVASFNDKNFNVDKDLSKVWTYTAKSGAVEIPATGKQETATVSISGKTVTYNGDRHYVTATTNSDVKPVVSYYKDAACTKQYSGAPYTAGTYYVKATVAASAKYTAAESAVVKLVIEKAKPNVKVTPVKKTVKNTSEKEVEIEVTQKNLNNQKGAVTYKSLSKKITVEKGVITIPQGTKKGTYEVKVTVKATTNYKKYTKKIKITVK